MSEHVHWLLEVEIVPGQLDSFTAVARDLIASTQNELDTLDYEWNLNESGTVCHIYERYRNSAAVVIHVQSFGKFAERFMQACRPVRFVIYGSPSEEVKAHLADLNPVYYSKFLGGFSR